MLGIRRFQNRTLDLWCGELIDFHTSLSSPHLNILDQALEQGERHIAITPFESEEAVDLEGFFTELKERLSALPHDRGPKRITIVTDDLLRYQRTMESFYRYFEELPWH